MATTFRTLIPFPAALLALAALASCGGNGGSNAGSDANGAPAADAAPPTQLFSENFKGVCSGAPVANATAYVPGPTAHKALYFETYQDDLTDRSSALPTDWTVLFSATGDALRAVDLVVCGRRTAAREVKVCDGYQNHGHPTQNRVRWHSATYELSVREARTGRQLATTRVEATDPNCPMFMSFDNDTDTIDGYASPSGSAVADFLRPHMGR